MKKFISPSLAAFITIIIAFFVLYYGLLSNYANALNLVWLILLITLAVAVVIRHFLKRHIAKQIQQELALTDEQAAHSKELKKAVKKRANTTYIGELAGYFWLFFIIFVVRVFGYEPFVIPSGSMKPTLQVGDYIGVNKHQYRLLTPITQSTIVKLNPIERGDVIVFKSPIAPNEDWIKRVIGVPGDVVHYNEYTREVDVFQGCKDPALVAKLNNFTANVDLADSAYVGCKRINFTYGPFKVDKNYSTTGLGNDLVRTESFTNQQGQVVTHRVLQASQALDYTHRPGLYQQPSNPPLTWVVPKDQYFVMGDNRDNSEDSRFIGMIPYKNVVGKAEFIWFSIPHNSDDQSYGWYHFDLGRMFTSVYDDHKPDVPTNLDKNKESPSSTDLLTN